MNTIQPFRFRPLLKPVLWGGHRIAALKHLPDTGQPIGESWEISPMPGHESVVATGSDAGLTLNELVARHGELLLGRDVAARYGGRFPLLVKLIDACQPLSIQVHPGDALAAERHHSPGKTEMWYVVDALPDATIMAGLKQALTPVQFEALARAGELEQVIAHYRPIVGDVFFLPAGTVHSIGAGNLLVEIQQASDVTYRLYDYGRVDADGRPRQLHLDEARQAVHYAPDAGIASHCSPAGPGMVKLVECEHFAASLLAVDGRQRLEWQPMRSMLVVVGTQGRLDVITDGHCHTTLAMGESLLIAACTRTIEVAGKGQAVVAHIPHNQ